MTPQYGENECNVDKNPVRLPRIGHMQDESARARFAQATSFESVDDEPGNVKQDKCRRPISHERLFLRIITAPPTALSTVRLTKGIPENLIPSVQLMHRAREG
jgi:hypothetical protein